MRLQPLLPVARGALMMNIVAAVVLVVAKLFLLAVITWHCGKNEIQYLAKCTIF